MRIIEPSVEFIYPASKEDWDHETRNIEIAGRNCYKSEDRIEPGSAAKFAKRLTDLNHHAMIEFGSVMIRLITDRACLVDLTRHRHVSFAVESTRYCNYTKGKFGGEITFVKSVDLAEGTVEYEAWKEGLKDAEQRYFFMIEKGVKAQSAKLILPHSLKVDMIMKCNFRELLHILKLRTSKAAHPDVQNIMNMVYQHCHAHCPEVFTI